MFERFFRQIPKKQPEKETPVPPVDTNKDELQEIPTADNPAIVPDYKDLTPKKKDELKKKMIDIQDKMREY